MLSATVCLLAACSQKDDPPTLVYKPIRVTPALLPEPSCSDTTDDGIFEVWNSSEDSLMFLPSKFKLPSGTFVPGFMSDFRIQKRRLSRYTPVVEWSARMDTSMQIVLAYKLVDKASGSVVATAYTMPYAKDADPLSHRKSFSTDLEVDSTLQPGCKRLYYYGTLSYNKSASGIPLELITYEVMFRGHFDVEID